MIPILMILTGLVGLYCSYLHYYDHLLPKNRGRHHIGPAMIRVQYISEQVLANLLYARGRITRNQWLQATGRIA